MSSCPQCGTVAKPTDKFCNVCGTPIPRAAAPAPAPPAQAAGYGAQPQPQPQYGAPPAAQPAYGAPQTARCQMGHEIAPGASYCAHGHPISLDQMQFAADPYAGGGGFGSPPAAAQPGYGPPPGGAFGAPPAYGAPPPAAPSPFGVQPGPQQGYAAPSPAAFGPPPGASPAYAPQAAYAPPGFGAAPAPAPAYAPAQPAYAPAPAAAPAPPAGPIPAPSPAFGSPPEAAPGAGQGRVLRGFLVSYGTNPSGDFWPLYTGRAVVGRHGTGDGVDVAVQDPTISSRHAVLVVDPASGGVNIEDTGSTNGTFVNDEHIGFNGRRELRDGDRIRFGGYTTVIKVIGRL